ncbi:Serine/threonine-protein kinase pkn6 [Roseovarius sp. THAF9]|uniref:serine/threonine protein kinase n=1 Tax=Roseovarius sp. THAF9 TaxID=2587847 RepID=UPI0012A84DA1|nr:serine/threonine-protein kinase [Roseovarius sp. THAF9]QFT92145.1 Serine/threonine-protein kinase pkn6 [Roseovarius sp. THAF9]
MQSNATIVSHLDADDLSPGQTLLHGQYKIERHLIGGGFGMTYLARDSLDRVVVVKECFPSTICRRVNGEVRPHKAEFQQQFQKVIRSFLREALRMAKFDHPNIVKIHQVFQENNTAYIAMDFVDGMDLLTMLEIEPERMADELIESLLRETLSALKYLHGTGMLHRDISPDNLLVDKSNKLTMIDFGAASEEKARKTRALSHMMAVKDGYSPHEFYYTDGDQRPSSDIYSVGATFYHLITGSAPPDCQKRVAALTSDMPDPYRPLAAGNWAFDATFLSAIDKALSVAQKDRFQSAKEWLDSLERAPTSDAELSIDLTAGVKPIAAPARPVTMASPPCQAALQDEGELASTISWLVQDTNTKVKPKFAKQSAEPVEEVSEEPSPLVDIFGQPIEDLQLWLAENDSPKLRRKPRSEPKVATALPQMSVPEETGNGLMRVLRRFTKRRNGRLA